MRERHLDLHPDQCLARLGRVLSSIPAIMSGRERDDLQPPADPALAAAGPARLAGIELADRLEVSGRTVRRDVERLRSLGYPVESMTGPAGGSSCAPGPRCRRCCSTTTRRSRSRSACGPPPAGR